MGLSIVPLLASLGLLLGSNLSADATNNIIQELVTSFEQHAILCENQKYLIEIIESALADPFYAPHRSNRDMLIRTISGQLQSDNRIFIASKTSTPFIWQSIATLCNSYSLRIPFIYVTDRETSEPFTLTTKDYIPLALGINKNACASLTDQEFATKLHAIIERPLARREVIMAIFTGASLGACMLSLSQLLLPAFKLLRTLTKPHKIPQRLSLESPITQEIFALGQKYDLGCALVFKDGYWQHQKDGFCENKRMLAFYKTKAKFRADTKQFGALASQTISSFPNLLTALDYKAPLYISPKEAPVLYGSIERSRKRLALSYRPYLFIDYGDTPVSPGSAIPGAVILSAHEFATQSQSAQDAIIGHEVGHLANNHSQKKEDYDVELLQKYDGNNKNLLPGLLRLGLSREHELEADEAAVKATGSANGLIEFFNSIEHCAPLKPNQIELFATHPCPETRIQKLKELQR